MNLLTKLTTHRAWLKLKFPAAALVVLLQRTPVARVIAAADEFVTVSPVGNLLRATAAAAASLGAMHSLAGATTLLPTAASPVSATVGAPITQVGFTVTNTINIASWKIGGTLPPGLTISAAQGGAMLTGPGTLDATTAGMDDGYGGYSGGVATTTPILSGTPTQAGTFTITLQAFEFGGLSGLPSSTFPFTINVAGGSPTAPTITAQPTNQAVNAGAGTSLSVAATASGGAPTFQWQQNGNNVSGATSATLTLASVQPANAGLYTATITGGGTTATSNPAIVGVMTTSKVIGAGAEIAHGVFVVSNGNTFDQVLPSGAALTVTAEPGKITRTSFVDVTKDIVQVEFSGAGAMSLVLDNASGPALPENYNQSTLYMKGHVGLVVTGADDTTNVSIFSVGKLTAVNAALFKDTVTYDGMADVAFIAIASTNGKFGGLRASNASFYAAKGITGVYAPGVQFQGPVFIGDIDASGTATPVILIGSSPDTRITGGDLLQDNGQPVQVSGLTQLKFTAGITSQGISLPAQNNKAVLRQNGTDVTAQVVVNPTSP